MQITYATKTHLSVPHYNSEDAVWLQNNRNHSFWWPVLFLPNKRLRTQVFCTSLLLHSTLFWALGVIVPFYFRSLGSFATSTHMDVANRLSGSYQFDIRINNVPVNKREAHCESRHMWRHEWGCSEVDELFALRLKTLTCVHPCSCSHDATFERPHLKFACEGIASNLNAGWNSWAILRAFCKGAS